MNKPNVLVLDIETSQMTARLWRTGDQHIRYKQVEKDWHLMAWGAKWLYRPAKEFIYVDQRREKSLDDDKAILKKLWSLLDKADLIVTQNGKAFDWPKLKARFMLNGMPPPSYFGHIDVYRELKDVGFTSHSLDYLTNKFCVKYKKLSHGKFPGDSLWGACAEGNKDAWKEMEKYNRNDVLSLEELLLNTVDWMPKVKYKIENPVISCKKCGGRSFWSNGQRSNSKGPYNRTLCKSCGTQNHVQVEVVK